MLLSNWLHKHRPATPSALPSAAARVQQQADDLRKMAEQIQRSVEQHRERKA